MEKEETQLPLVESPPVIDDPYTFGQIVPDAPDTSQQEAVQAANTEPIKQEDQPFHAKHGFESEEAMVDALNKARFNTDNQQVMDRISALETMIREQAQPVRQPEPAIDKEALAKKLADDPLGAIDDLISHRMQTYTPPVDEETRVTNMIMKAVMDPNKPDFKELIPDIEKYLASLPNLHELQGNPMVLDLAYNVVKAKKVIEKAQQRPQSVRQEVVAGRTGAVPVNTVPRDVSYDTMFAGRSRNIDTLLEMLENKS